MEFIIPVLVNSIIHRNLQISLRAVKPRFLNIVGIIVVICNRMACLIEEKFFQFFVRCLGVDVKRAFNPFC